MKISKRGSSRATALLLATALTGAPLAGCSNNRQDQPPPAVDDTRGGGTVAARQQRTDDRPGMSSTKKKVIVLAGAAALYWLYKHHKNASADANAAQTGEDSQYYLSKNGRVYYRDADHRAHWVTAPPSGIEVPANEAAEYQGFQGYDNQSTGRDLQGLGTDSE